MRRQVGDATTASGMRQQKAEICDDEVEDAQRYAPGHRQENTRRNARRITAATPTRPPMENHDCERQNAKTTNQMDSDIYVRAFVCDSMSGLCPNIVVSSALTLFATGVVIR